MKLEINFGKKEMVLAGLLIFALLSSSFMVEFGSAITNTPIWRLAAPPVSAFDYTVGQYTNGTFFAETGDWQSWQNNQDANVTFSSVLIAGNTIYVSNGAYDTVDLGTLPNNLVLTIDASATGITYTPSTGDYIIDHAAQKLYWNGVDETALFTNINSIIGSAPLTWGQISSADSTVNGLISSYLAGHPIAYSSLTGTPNPTATATYVISVNGSNYQAVNSLGQICWSSTNPVTVFNSAFAVGSGQTIAVQTGTYNLPSKIDVQYTDNITLSFANGAILFVANNMLAPAIELENCNNWVITGATINGNAPTQTSPSQCNGIEVYGGTNVLITKANIYNVAQFGVYFSGSNNSGVTYSTLTNCYWNGITLGSSGEFSLYADHNYVNYAGDVGITSYGKDDIVTDNTVYNMSGTHGSGNTEWGIGVEGGGNTTITGNHITSCLYGIYLDTATATSNTVTSNTISTCTDIGIVSIADYNQISSNMIINIDPANTYKNGISINGNYSIISGNTLIGTTSHSEGILLSQKASYNQISGNIITVNDYTISDQSTGVGGNIINDPTMGHSNPIGNYDVTGIPTTIVVMDNVLTGSVLYLSSNTYYYLANSVSVTTMNTVAMAVQNATSGSQCIVINQGYYMNPNWSWTVGGSLYVSNSTAGGLTQTLPATTGNIDQYVGYAVSATEIYFAPSPLTVTR